MKVITHWNILVLVSAGIESIFFSVAGTGLCLGFRRRIMSIMQWCLTVAKQCLLWTRDFLVSRALALSRCMRSWEGAWLGQLSWPGQGDIPYAQSINWGELLIDAWGQAECPSVGAESLYCQSPGIKSSWFLFHSFLFITTTTCLYLNTWVLPFFQVSSPSHLGGQGVKNCLCGSYLPAGIKLCQYCRYK